MRPYEDALIALGQRTVSEQIQKDVFAVFEQMGRYHPSEPHWYLPLMGVDCLSKAKDWALRYCNTRLSSSIATKTCLP